ncbi:MAG: precorrin-6A reductase [Lachnospiraceae bacterium]|nr:precorrin-6A reductase [Lachnospiraceae bacterium]
MNKVLIFAGTTEGRKLSECLAKAQVAHTVCVATEYGEIVLKEHPLVSVHKGRMNREEIREYIVSNDFAAVVDATHPYAEVVTCNIKSAMRDLEIPYLRLKREIKAGNACGNVHYFGSNEACAKALEEAEGNILLTTGSKELAVYCSSEEVKKRLYVRVLPGIESLQLCMEQGIAGKQILALQGPFTVEMNEAMLHQYRIKCLVTKESGKAGGYEEKLRAAEKAGIPVYVIGCSKGDEGDSFAEICHKLEKVCGKNINRKTGFEIVLAGVGMGNKDSLTQAVYRAIDEADILLGAERMIAGYQSKLEKKSFYKADEIIPYLEEMQNRVWDTDCVKVVVLFSGDSGFYSGCQKLYHALQAEVTAGRLDAKISVLPGISSVAYLASCIGESYHDAAIYSIHGKEISNLPGKISRAGKMFLLLSGVKDINKLGKLLIEAGLRDCTVSVGYQLSYPEEQILELLPEECMERQEEGLYVCCVKNPKVAESRLTHGRADEEFLRGKVPMTKEEVREVSICKLKLHEGAVVYDIGSGTGSIAVEIAGLSDRIQVYAVEKKNEAVELITNNKTKFQLENIQVIKADAPEGLRGLPVPTHAFIGGSGGKLKDILTSLYQMNPQMRVVINAISMETICELKEVTKMFSVWHEEIVQMQVSRAKSAGAYHLMQAENPVWICAFDFAG